MNKNSNNSGSNNNYNTMNNSINNKDNSGGSGGSGKYENISSPKTTVLKKIKDMFGSSNYQNNTINFNNNNNNNYNNSNNNNNNTSYNENYSFKNNSENYEDNDFIYNSSTLTNSQSSGNLSLLKIINNNNQYSINDIENINDRLRTELKNNKYLTLGSRVTFLKEFCDYIKFFRMENIEHVWNCASDLLEDGKPIEAQIVAMQMMLALIESNYGILGDLRSIFYNIITDNKNLNNLQQFNSNNNQPVNNNNNNSNNNNNINSNSLSILSNSHKSLPLINYHAQFNSQQPQQLSSSPSTNNILSSSLPQSTYLQDNILSPSQSNIIESTQQQSLSYNQLPSVSNITTNSSLSTSSLPQPVLNEKSSLSSSNNQLPSVLSPSSTISSSNITSPSQITSTSAHLSTKSFQEQLSQQIQQQQQQQQQQSNLVLLNSKIKAFGQLIKQGKDMIPFENEVIQVLIGWLSIMSNYHRNSSNIQNTGFDDLLIMIENIIKNGSSILAEGDIASIIDSMCVLCNSTSSIGIIESCLSFFNTITKMVVIPPSCVSMVIGSLCRTVNIESACNSSWETMQSLLEKYGNQGIHSLCSILNDPQNRNTINLLRGAVFFIGMSIWGSQRISSLNISSSYVLPSLYNSLSGRQEIIAYEVILALRRLVKKYGNELHVEWDLIFLIIERMQSLLVNNSDQENANNSLFKVLRDTVSHIEELDERNCFEGSKTALFEISAPYFKYKTEDSILMTIDKQKSKIHPSHALWIKKMSLLIELFYRKDPRTRIRKRILLSIRQIYFQFQQIYGEEILEKLVAPTFSDIYKDRDVHIRTYGIEILIEILAKSAGQLSSSVFHQLLSILERSIMISSHKEMIVYLEVSKISVRGLIQIFKNQLYHSPPQLALDLWSIILSQISNDSLIIRREVLYCISNISSNKWYQLLYQNHSSLFLHFSQSNNFLSDLSKMLTKLPMSPRSPRSIELNNNNNNSNNNINNNETDNIVEDLDDTSSNSSIEDNNNNNQSQNQIQQHPTSPPPNQNENQNSLSLSTSSLPNSSNSIKKQYNPNDGGYFSNINILNSLLERLVKETNYELYLMILEIISNQLKNKYILIGLENETQSLVNLLSKSLSDRTLGNCINDFQNSDINKKETLYIMALEILCNLIPYQNSSSPFEKCQNSISNLISTLTICLGQKWSNENRSRVHSICLNGLMISAVEFSFKVTLKHIQNITKSLYSILTSSNTNKETFFTILQYFNLLISINNSSVGLSQQLPFETLTFIFKLIIQFIDKSRYSSLIVVVAFQSLIRWFTSCTQSTRTLLVKNIIKTLDSQLKEKKDTLLIDIAVELLNRYIHTDIDPCHYPIKHSSPLFQGSQIKTWFQNSSSTLITIRTGRLGWSEVTLRKATGCVSWLMRFQNNFNPLLSSNNYNLYNELSMLNDYNQQQQQQQQQLQIQQQQQVDQILQQKIIQYQLNNQYSSLTQNNIYLQQQQLQLQQQQLQQQQQQLQQLQQQSQQSQQPQPQQFNQISNFQPYPTSSPLQQQHYQPPSFKSFLINRNSKNEPSTPSSSPISGSGEFYQSINNVGQISFAKLQKQKSQQQFQIYQQQQKQQQEKQQQKSLVKETLDEIKNSDKLISNLTDLIKKLESCSTSTTTTTESAKEKTNSSNSSFTLSKINLSHHRSNGSSISPRNENDSSISKLGLSFLPKDSTSLSSNKNTPNIHSSNNIQLLSTNFLISPMIQSNDKLNSNNQQNELKISSSNIPNLSLESLNNNNNNNSNNNNNNQKENSDNMGSSSYNENYLSEVKVPQFTPKKLSLDNTKSYSSGYNYDNSSVNSNENLFLNSNLDSPYKLSYDSNTDDNSSSTPTSFNNNIHSLSRFYPPLPSYDDDEELLSFFSSSSPTQMASSSSDLNSQVKLNLSAQLLLHADPSSPNLLENIKHSFLFDDYQQSQQPTIPIEIPINDSSSSSSNNNNNNNNNNNDNGNNDNGIKNNNGIKSNSNKINNSKNKINNNNNGSGKVVLLNSNTNSLASSTSSLTKPESEIFSLSVENEDLHQYYNYDGNGNEDNWKPNKSKKYSSKTKKSITHNNNNNSCPSSASPTISSIATKINELEICSLGSGTNDCLVKSTSFNIEGTSSSSNQQVHLISPIPILAQTPSQSPLNSVKSHNQLLTPQKINISENESAFNILTEKDQQTVKIESSQQINNQTTINSTLSSTILTTSTLITSTLSNHQQHGSNNVNNKPSSPLNQSTPSIKKQDSSNSIYPIVRSSSQQSLLAKKSNNNNISSNIINNNINYNNINNNISNISASPSNNYSKSYNPYIVSKPLAFSPNNNNNNNNFDNLYGSSVNNNNINYNNKTAISPSQYGSPTTAYPGLSPPHSPSPPPVQLEPHELDFTILDPSIVFYHLHQFSGDITTEIKMGNSFERSLSVLDHTFCSETYKFGILYCAADQNTEEQILSNSKGSQRYHQFLNSMGETFRLHDRLDVYPGGLDRNPTKTDGEYSIYWKDRICQVIFHVATMMPSIDTDKLFTNKKRHIGNDYVNIIFSESPNLFNNHLNDDDDDDNSNHYILNQHSNSGNTSDDEKISKIISGQFNFVLIVVSPLEDGWYRVEIKKKRDIPLFGPIHNNQIISSKSLPTLIIQTAINANLISMQYDGKTDITPNLEERLKQIKTIKERFAQDEEWLDLLSLKKINK